MTRVADLVALTKPGVTRMCAVTTAGGAGLAASVAAFSWPVAIAAVVGASLAVAAASTFNMWWERELDPRMARTAGRPLAAGRMGPRVALGLAWGLTALSLAVLWIGTNALTAGLAMAAIAGYVLVYTPLKVRTPLALLIGAFPGAVPPLLGWTAITGELGAGGLSLFAILLVWQLPHYLAITLFRQDEFARAGIRCVPVVRGEGVARLQAAAWVLVLVPVSLLPWIVGVTGPLYAIAALLLGGAFAARGLRGLSARRGPAWARGLFVASLLYLPALMAAMVADVWLR